MDTTLPPRGLLRQALATWLGKNTGHHVFLADGSAVPPPQATVTGLTRLVLTIAGRNQQEMVHGNSTMLRTVTAGGAVVVTARAWNRPTFGYPYTFVTIEWQADVIRYYVRTHTAAHSADGPRFLYFHPRAAVPTTRALVQALEGLARRGAESALAPTVLALVHQAAWELDQATEEISDARWLHVRDWLEQHLEQAIDRQAVATACHLHPNSISRLVAQKTGESFVALVTRQRLERACGFLQRYAAADLSIAEIARHCGFQSGEYFANVFKRAYGCSPRAWARSQEP